MLARNLELRHLQALEAVAATGTFGRAAERLGYTQSAISQQVAALERAVGDRLFDRPGGPRAVELTPLGRLLVAHAREVLQRVDAAAADLRRFQAGAVGRIELGTFQSISTAILPSLLGRLRAERPDVKARLVESDDEDLLVRMLIDGEVELSFLVGKPPPEVERVELFVDPFVVVALPGNGAQGLLPTAQLAGTPLIGQQDNACQRRVDDGLHAAGVTPDYVFRTNDNSAAMAMVRAGVGMAVLPLLAVEQDDPRMVILALDPPIPPRHVSIGWRRGRTLSPTAQRVLELAQEFTADLSTPALAAAR